MEEGQNTITEIFEYLKGEMECVGAPSMQLKLEGGFYEGYKFTLKIEKL